MNTSLGAIPEMLYYIIVGARTGPEVPTKAYAGMKWFRSNIRLGSRLALFALAIQFVLSFGHFHGSSAQAASVSAGAKRAGLHHILGFAAMHMDASDRASQSNDPARLPGPPTDDCAICAVMALANAAVDATPPCLPAPQAFAFSYLGADAGFVDLNSARVAFQPRAPPIA